jgi:hypothetical protein
MRRNRATLPSKYIFNSETIYYKYEDKKKKVGEARGDTGAIE